jgi:hypothetical protein
VAPSTLRFDVCDARDTDDITGDPGEPEAGGYEPEAHCRWGRTGGTEWVVAEGCEGGREDLEIDQVGEVFEGLVQDIGEALGYGNGVNVGVSRVGGLFGGSGGEECTQPGVEGKEAGKSERGAGVG